MSLDLTPSSSTSCATFSGIPFLDMDPEEFKTPWKVVEEHFGSNVLYLVQDSEGEVVAIVGREDYAQFIVFRVNRYFEGL